MISDLFTAYLAMVLVFILCLILVVSITTLAVLFLGLPLMEVVVGLAATGILTAAVIRAVKT